MIKEVLDQLIYLKLKSAYSYLKELHLNNDISNTDLAGIYKILNKEVEAKEENNKLYNVKVAAFPFLKKIEEYDFDFQPSVKKEKIYSIIDSDFYQDGTNIVFIGNPGTGKTHLAISIAYTVAIKKIVFILLNSVN
ncbi:MAG: ATP-binding protein [Bacillales bacterium]